MPHGNVVLAGNLPVEHLDFDLLVKEYGWSVKRADNLFSVAELNSRHNVVAVLFSPKSLGLSLTEAIDGVLEAAPRALPILCHRFSDTIEWPQAAEAGAFHSLHLPFSASEIRQSLSFVRAKRSQAPLQMPRRDVKPVCDPAQDTNEIDLVLAAGNAS